MTRVREVGARSARRLCLLLGIGATAGCSILDRALEVEAPSRIIANQLEGPAAAGLLVKSAISDFECAFGGYILASGQHGDVFKDGDLAGSYWEVDRREVSAAGSGFLATQNCDDLNTIPGIYTPVQTARFEGDQIARRLEGWTDAEVPGRQLLLATAKAYAGYAMLLLGESYCSIAIDLGPEIQRLQVLAEAENRFTAAIAAAQTSNNTAILNMARVGRARARLSLAIQNGTVANATLLAAARTDAAAVPAGFVRNATFADTPIRRRNQVYNANNVAQTSTIEEDFRGVTDEGVADPRVRVTDAGRLTFDRVTPLWTQSKYTALGTPIPIARYAEAQLIVAEVALETGDLTTATNIINAFHTAAGLPAFAGGTAAQVREHLRGSSQNIVTERERELFMESQHLGDKLRYNLPFTPAAGTPYPPKAGGQYGSTTCFPLPNVERFNNPNLN